MERSDAGESAATALAAEDGLVQVPVTVLVQMAVVALGRPGAHHAGGPGGAGAVPDLVLVLAEIPGVPLAAEPWAAVDD